MRYKPHFIKRGGHWRVLYRSPLDGTLLLPEMIPYKYRRSDTMTAHKFLREQNQRDFLNSMIEQEPDERRRKELLALMLMEKNKRSSDAQPARR